MRPLPIVKKKITLDFEVEVPLNRADDREYLLNIVYEKLQGRMRKGADIEIKTIGDQYARPANFYEKAEDLINFCNSHDGMCMCDGRDCVFYCNEDADNWGWRCPAWCQGNTMEYIDYSAPGEIERNWELLEEYRREGKLG